MSASAPRIIIRTPLPSEVARVGEIIYYTWLATYPSAEYGISEEEVAEAVAPQLDADYIAIRAKRLADGLPPERLQIIAEVDGVILGTASANKYPEGGQKVGSLYVLPEAQGKGIGSALMYAILEWMEPTRPISLTVASYNQQAIGFYSKHGFEITDEVVSSAAATLPRGSIIPELAMRREPID